MAVPTGWLSESRRYCYFLRTAINKAIHKKEKPAASWDVFIAKQFSSKDIPMYEKAIRKEKKSVIASASTACTKVSFAGAKINDQHDLSSYLIEFTVSYVSYVFLSQAFY